MTIRLPAAGPDLPIHPLPHPHTGLPVRALGLRRNGAPIWPSLGAAEDDSGDGDDGAEDDGEDGSDEGVAELGDAGKKALDSMKGKWRKERDARKALEDRLAKLDKPGDKPDEQPDAETLRKQARAEAWAEVARDRALDKVETRAAKLFADPEDARALLASQIDDFIDDGDIDTDLIDEALSKLLKKKPHLAAATAGKRFNGSADGGARNGSGKPTQLTEQDLKRMTPHQIVEARQKGQLDELMGG